MSKTRRRRTASRVVRVVEPEETRSVRHRNVVGKLINFRGLVYAPVNENGVIFLFGKMAADLNMYIETIRPGYPDCVAKRYIGKGRWEEVRIEFEFRSSDFARHRHHPPDCDAIVCWIDDWDECPKNIEVIELQSEIPQLRNTVIEEPDKVTELSEHNIDDLFEDKKVQELYERLHPQVAKIDRDIWRKVGGRCITYYSPERVFAYVDPQRQGLRLTVFTNGQRVPNVEQLGHGRGGTKWGRLYVKGTSDCEPAATALKVSQARMNKAVQRGEKTGWYAEED